MADQGWQAGYSIFPACRPQPILAQRILPRHPHVRKLFSKPHPRWAGCHSSSSTNEKATQMPQHHTIDLNTAQRTCCATARHLLETGEAHPDDTISFVRGSTPVFNPGPITWWSQRRVREADASGPMRFALCDPEHP